ncbi:MAG: hypothetical protein K2X27_08765, partial [Candidatus Obscuribacterales bacterium]|nr:hypothetical protein [Candidatus Obscuribacterales bacterium]
MQIVRLLLLSALFLAISAKSVKADEWENNLKAKATQQFQTGLRAEQAGDLNQALEWYRKAMSNYPSFKEVHYKAGLAAARLGMNDEAMLEFRQALNLDNNYVQARNDYALFLQHNKNDEEGAMQQWKQCKQINPKYPFPYYFTGLVLHRRGDLD